MSESEPEYQEMLDEGLARYFDVKCLCRIQPGSGPRGDSSRGMRRGGSKGSCDRKLVIKTVGTDDNPADVGTKWFDDVRNSCTC